MGSNTSRLEDSLRENKRKINRTIRELERQKLRTQRDEENTISKIKSEARQGHITNARLLAKDVLRNRKLGNHFLNMRSQMLSLQSQLQAAQSTNVLTTSFKNVSDLMTQVNCNTNVVEFQKIMSNISHQGMAMNLKLDMIEEAMDDSFLGVDDSLQDEKAINELMEELGVGVSSTLDNLNPPQNQDLITSNNKTLELTNSNNFGEAQQMLDIEERINNLKK